MRPYLDLFMHILLMQDTWQHHRLLSMDPQRYLLPHITWSQPRWLTPFVCLLWFCYSALLRVHTSLWWSPDDHPACMDGLHYQKTAYVPPHQVFSQFVQQVNIYVCQSLSDGRLQYAWATSCLEQCKRVGVVCSMWVYVYMCDTYLKQLYLFLIVIEKSV